MAKRDSDEHLVRVDPYRARPMESRGEQDGRRYYRIRLAGKTIKGTPGWYTADEVRDRMLELLIEARAQAQILASQQAADEEPWTVERMLSAWVGTVVEEMPPRRRKTKASYENCARVLVAIAGDIQVERITRQTLRQLVAKLEDPETRARVSVKPAPPGRGYAGRTIRLILTVLRIAWTWAAELGHAPAVIPKSPQIKMKRVNCDRMPEHEEALRVIACLDGGAGPHPVATALSMQLASGARIDEICALTNDDIMSIEGQAHEDPAHDTRCVWVRFSRSKTGPREVPFRRSAAGMIMQMHRPDEPTQRLLRYSDGPRAGRPVGAGFKSVVSAALRRLDWAQLGIERFTTHGLRDRFINSAIDAGVLPSVVAELCGNSVEEIMRSYRKVRPGQVVGAIDRVDLVLAGKVVDLSSRR